MSGSDMHPSALAMTRRRTTAPGEEELAVRTVPSRATSADDARLLLDALGLMDTARQMREGTP